MTCNKNFRLVFSGGSTSPQYAVNPHPQAQYAGTYSPPPPEPVDFSGLPRPIGVEYVSSLGSSTYSRESTPSNGSSHFMEGYRDFNGKNAHPNAHTNTKHHSQANETPLTYASYTLYTKLFIQPH